MDVPTCTVGPGLDELDEFVGNLLEKQWSGREGVPFIFYFLFLSCIVTFDREGVSIFIVFSFSYYVVELEYLDRVGRKLDAVIVFYFGICLFLKLFTPSVIYFLSHLLSNHLF